MRDLFVVAKELWTTEYSVDRIIRLQVHQNTHHDTRIRTTFLINNIIKLVRLYILHYMHHPHPNPCPHHHRDSTPPHPQAAPARKQQSPRAEEEKYATLQQPPPGARPPSPFHLHL